ncbi:MAG TPA: response regulator [Opitutaceae bacterium]|nr:response regulator [Opitutaceae bacterium]
MPRILLIDDDDGLRRVLAKSLGYAGHDVVQASDGRQGIELFRASSFDLVITDLVMPVQEGVETIVRLRKENANTPIIAISGGLTNSKLYLTMAEKIGARRVLGKPFVPSELIQAVNEVLGLEKPPAEKGDGAAAGPAR